MALARLTDTPSPIVVLFDDIIACTHQYNQKNYLLDELLTKYQALIEKLHAGNESGDLPEWKKRIILCLANYLRFVLTDDPISYHAFLNESKPFIKSFFKFSAQLIADEKFSNYYLLTLYVNIENYTNNLINNPNEERFKLLTAWQLALNDFVKNRRHLQDHITWKAEHILSSTYYTASFSDFQNDRFKFQYKAFLDSQKFLQHAKSIREKAADYDQLPLLQQSLLQLLNVYEARIVMMEKLRTDMHSKKKLLTDFIAPFDKINIPQLLAVLEQAHDCPASSIMPELSLGPMLFNPLLHSIASLADDTENYVNQLLGLIECPVESGNRHHPQWTTQHRLLALKLKMYQLMSGVIAIPFAKQTLTGQELNDRAEVIRNTQPRLVAKLKTIEDFNDAAHAKASQLEAPADIETSARPKTTDMQQTAGTKKRKKKKKKSVAITAAAPDSSGSEEENQQKSVPTTADQANVALSTNAPSSLNDIPSMTLPNEVLANMKLLTNSPHFFKTLIVGGAVRVHILNYITPSDIFLDEKPNDYDVVSAAYMVDIQAAFEGKGTTLGKDNPTVVVPLPSGTHMDITSMRGQFNSQFYKTFTTSNGEFHTQTISDDPAIDAMSRDFTCNAIYYDPIDQCFIDPCNGFTHMQKNELVFVNNVDKALMPDGVRLLRAIRLMASTSLTVSAETKNEMRQKPYLTFYRKRDSRNNDRIHHEIQRTLSMPNTEKVLSLLAEYDVLNELYEIDEHKDTAILAVIKTLLTNETHKKNLPLLWCALLTKQFAAQLKTPEDVHAALQQPAVFFKNQLTLAGIPKSWRDDVAYIWLQHHLSMNPSIVSTTTMPFTQSHQQMANILTALFHESSKIKKLTAQTARLFPGGNVAGTTTLAPAARRTRK